MLISNNFRSNPANKTVRFGCTGPDGLCPELKKVIDGCVDTTCNYFNSEEKEAIKQNNYQNAYDEVNYEKKRFPVHKDAVNFVANKYNDVINQQKEQQSGQMEI